MNIEDNKKLKLLIYGSSSIADMVYFDSLGRTDIEVVALVVDKEFLNKRLRPTEEISFDSCIEKYNSSHYMLTIDSSIDRNGNHLSKYAKSYKYPSLNYISNKAIISGDVLMGENNLILENVYIGPGVRFGNNNIIRQNSYIGHDCNIGDNNIFSPGVNVGGYCSIGEFNFFGIGSTVINNLIIRSNNIIGAGAVLVKNVVDNSTIVGNPGKQTNG